MIEFMIPLTKLMYIGGGTLLGCVIRQPEINRLKRQLKALQEDNSKIKKLMIRQQDALQKMLAEYAKLRFTQTAEKKEMDEKIRGLILEGYLYKEYVDLLDRAIRTGGNESFSEEEKQFFELSFRLIEDKKLSAEEEKALEDYVLYKYKREIKKKKDVKIVEYVNRKYA